jgi:hypothetical protein
MKSDEELTMSASMTIMLDVWRDVTDEEIVELETA